MPRRRPGTLLPIELGILSAAITVRGDRSEFHGFEMAKLLQDADQARRLTAHGTLYKALARLEQAGLLTSRWEAPETALAEGRPRRRLYTLTGDGELAVAAAESARRRSSVPLAKPGLATP
jgi:PadR family transcriptional regulator, regulatory protein PadR